MLRDTPPSLVITCARGSSDHAATFAKYLIETQLGVPTASFAPSISSVYKARLKVAGVLFIAISQSGQSPDLVASAEAARDAGALVVTIVNADNSPLARVGQIRLPLHAGLERSVAATKSFIASLAALLQIVAHWGESEKLNTALNTLPGDLDAAAALDWSEAIPAFSEADDMLVVGRGFGFAIAQEAALKLKETAVLHAEPFSAAEIEHGPMALVRDGFPILVFSQQDETRAGVQGLVSSLRDKGGRVFVAEQGPAAPGRLPVVTGVAPAAALVTMIQSFYFLANTVALARGRDPDDPPHLRKETGTL
jgi:glucosamine--fructose-6-phosphate aminotransferase (isomerizing)